MLDAALRHYSGNGAITTVVGFPLGNTLSDAKAYEADLALQCGATEIDMVVNNGLLSEARKKYDIAAVADIVAKHKDCALKVIIETCYLSPGAIEDASIIVSSVAKKYGIPAFVKTSTGFGKPVDGIPVGATVAGVEKIREALNQQNDYRTGIKAAGGISTFKKTAQMMIAAELGHAPNNLADRFRIGASAGKKILDEFQTLKQNL